MRILCLLFVLIFFPSFSEARIGPNVKLVKIAESTVSGKDRNYANHSFARAKHMLEDAVYFDHRETLYCGFSFNEHKNVLLPDGFQTPAHPGRSRKIEWEHAVPAENFGRSFPEWEEGSRECIDSKGNPFKGRKCVEKANPEYRYMQADMHNLFPAVGAVNAVRSNYRYSELPGVPSSFGICKAKVDGKRFEPPDRAKGQVARAALYMDAAYPRYSLSRQQRQLFEAWNKKFPVTEWECVRSKRISNLQRNDNKFVKEQCQKMGMW